MLQSSLDGLNNRITRRHFALSLAISLGLPCSASAVEDPLITSPEPFRLSAPLPDVIGQVTPKLGVPTGIVFGDSIQKLIAAGALDPDKLRASDRDLPDWVERLLWAPSEDPILFSEQTAPYLVNLLWPLGLANRVSFNEKSPISAVRIPGFASTGGWTLGRAPNGYAYFNRVDAIELTDAQQAIVLEVAKTTFRPCCDNSTFFQDCNHGSALLGLLELAASQGATEQGLYGLALTANSFWFPDYYAKTALYFAHFHHKDWSAMPPKAILGREYSSLTGWEKNVNERLLQANVMLPGQSKGQQAC
jgi:hypothetical protein